MLNRPALNELVQKAGCRYLLVTAVAKRARQLQDRPEKLNGRKPVTAAVEGKFRLKTRYRHIKIRHFVCGNIRGI